MAVSQKALNRGLGATLKKVKVENRRSLGSSDRYIIFSDLHKGARNKADEFMPCEQTYLAALDHYLENGYTLVVLGDAEELWEEKVEDVMAAYDNVLQSEGRFHKDGRYIRVYGNHDDLWRYPKQVKNHLHRYYPNLEVHDGLLLEYADDKGLQGQIFLTHGHQGTLDSDALAWFSRIWLPLYREFQILTGFGKTTPAKDACLRAEHDTKMYHWTKTEQNLILIAGHTHRPIWSSRTHLEKLLNDLYTMLEEKGDVQDTEVVSMKAEIKRREDKYPPCTDTIKTRPSYFNTGCCRFADGDITGLEIDSGQIRLVKWGEKDGRFVRHALEETALSEVFFFL